MNKLDLSNLEDMFPAIYVTLASVLLGLALDDLVSQIRAANDRGPLL